MKNYLTVFSIVIAIVGFAVIFRIHNLVQQSPIRHAVYKNASGNYTKINTSYRSSTSDRKAQIFANDIIVKCFSLTVNDAISKGKTCREKYFDGFAGFIYEKKYVNPLSESLDEKSGSQFTASNMLPVIINQPRKPSYAYQVHSKINFTFVTSTDTAPNWHNMTLMIKPTVASNNPSQFMVTAMRLH